MIDAVYPLLADYFAACREVVTEGFDGIFAEKRNKARSAVKDTQKLDRRVRKINSMILQSLALPKRNDKNELSPDLALTVYSLQQINHFLQDMTQKCYNHLNNHHHGFQSDQIEELRQVEEKLVRLLVSAEKINRKKRATDVAQIKKCNTSLEKLLVTFDKAQIKRIQSKQSKTRVSMLYFSILSTAGAIAQHVWQLISSYTQKNSAK